MPLNRDFVQPHLGSFGEKGATSGRLAKKLTNHGGGPTYTAGDVDDFFRAAPNDPPWFRKDGEHWKIVLSGPVEANTGDLPIIESLPETAQLAEPADQSDERPELIRRIIAMRKDALYPAWFTRPDDNLEKLEPKVLRAILRRGNDAIQLLQELGRHSDHPAFSGLVHDLEELRQRLEAANEEADRLQGEKQTLNQQVSDLIDRPTQGQLDEVQQEVRSLTNRLQLVRRWAVRLAVIVFLVGVLIGVFLNHACGISWKAVGVDPVQSVTPRAGSDKKSDLRRALEKYQGSRKSRKNSK